MASHDLDGVVAKQFGEHNVVHDWGGKRIQESIEGPVTKDRGKGRTGAYEPHVYVTERLHDAVLHMVEVVDGLCRRERAREKYEAGCKSLSSSSWRMLPATETSEASVPSKGLR